MVRACRLQVWFNGLLVGEIVPGRVMPKHEEQNSRTSQGNRAPNLSRPRMRETRGYMTLTMMFFCASLAPDDDEAPSSISARFTSLLFESSSAINDQAGDSTKISSGYGGIPGAALRMAGVGATRHTYEKAHNIAVPEPLSSGLEYD